MRQAHSAAFDRRIDWIATLANLRALHSESHAAATIGHPSDAVAEAVADIHETVHCLATSLGAPDDWLHAATAARS